MCLEKAIEIHSLKLKTKTALFLLTVDVSCSWINGCWYNHPFIQELSVVFIGAELDMVAPPSIISSSCHLSAAFRAANVITGCANLMSDSSAADRAYTLSTRTCAWTSAAHSTHAFAYTTSGASTWVTSASHTSARNWSLSSGSCSISSWHCSTPPC
jgi:hypothetical protein